jgi:hypothetical protein
MHSEFEKNGYYVLRGVLTEAQVDRLAAPIRNAFAAGDYDTYEEDSAYPLPGIHSMGPRILEKHPEIADLSLAHPAIVEAVEALFGEPATLAQYWSIMRPPGAGVSTEPFVKGSATHYDYKPWRSVGSYVNWMFAVIPFVDYIETAGPLAVAPGSHLQTTVLPSNGRVHQVDAAQVPSPSNISLVDPQLKKGDVVLMHGFTWHEARPNYGNSDRCGLYMKFHAKSSPPACGPTIYPTAVHDFLGDQAKHLIPHHRGDGQFAALRDAPVGGVDAGSVLIEDSEGQILLVDDGANGWRVPTFAATEDASAGILDVCNVMGSILEQTREQLGLRLPWLSWLLDVTGAPCTRDASESRCRVYGHRLVSASSQLTVNSGLTLTHCWMSGEALEQADHDGLLVDGSLVRKCLHMWQNEVDENDMPVTRSFGVPTTDVALYSFNRNGNTPGTYRVGEFDEQGKPNPAAHAHA